MRTLLITGGAGFIGSNLVHYALDRTADRIVVVDKLTYAGSLLNLERPLADPRVSFVRAELAVRGEQGVGGSSRSRLLAHLPPAGADHELLEQLRAVSVSGEADPSDDPECARRQAAADLRRRRQRARLAARRGSLRWHHA